MSNITIPPEALEAAARAAWGYEGTSAWERAMARKIIAAAISAWPGSYSLAENDSAEIRDVAAIILPVTENTNDKV